MMIHASIALGLLEAFREELAQYPNIRRYLICVSRPVSMGWPGTSFEEMMLRIIWTHFHSPEVSSDVERETLNEQCYHAARYHEIESQVCGGRMRFWRIK